MSLRRIVSLSLMLSIVGMLTSSIVLYIVPQGRVAYWAGWTLWGLSKSQWGAVHTNMGLLMLVAGSFHVYYNWRPMTSYMKNKAREFRLFTPNFTVAFVVFAVFVTLTIVGAPPAVMIQDLRANLEEGAADSLGEPPYGHAEESSLRVFNRNVGLDPEVVRARLEEAGIAAPDSEATILDLALSHGLTPQQLFEIMRGPEEERPTGALPIPDTMPMGTGRLSLEAFCGQYNRDVDEAAAILEKSGLKVDRSKTLKDIATDNGVEALDILDALRKGYGE